MPILNANAVELFSNSADQSRRLGIQLGAVLQVGDLICLEGNLGSGKTTLMKGIAAGWGSADPVTSPTFVLIKIYDRGDQTRLAHMDAYRLEGPAEAESLDLDVLLSDGPLVVEWAEKIGDALPSERLWLKLFWVEEDRRRFEVTPFGKRYESLLEEFQEAVFGIA